MTVDEILFKSIANGGDADFIPAATVRMDVVGNFLYIELTNTSQDPTPSENSGNVLSAVAFSLPDGVSLGSGSGLGSASNDIDFGSSSALTSGGSLTNQTWGLGDPDSGHFDGSPNWLTYKLVVATHLADADVTLTGVTATSSNIGQFDYALKSQNAGPGPSGQLPFVQDQLIFELELFGTIPANIVTTINTSAVGVAFDSPDASTIPEPSTFLIWSLLGAFGIIAVRRRKR